ncbi:hypothetical protein PLICRDRAFT_37302 [Plicaturopsis crispa FD-325 SS-3]|nr:hypothetical protein PLICRDRAFT_37302 [Plicaturopsis crispa FD-325 SS-3]
MNRSTLGDQASIVALEGKAEKLEALESDLLQQLRDVRYALAHVRSQVANLVNRRTSISRLPDELLAEIFSHGEPAYTQRGLPSQVTVSHVSQHWRQVAIGTPMLWTRICIVGHQPVEYVRYYPLGLLDVHLDRSRSCLLHIRCDIDSDAFFRKIIAHAHRWSSFAIAHRYAYSDMLSRLLRQLIDLRAPNLRHLAIEGVPSALPTAIFTGGVPLLSSLTLSGFMLSECRIPGICHRLTVLNFVGPSYGVRTLALIQSVLTETSSLEELGICEFRMDVEVQLADPVELPTLRKLDIGFIDMHSDDYVTCICSALVMPALECLKLREADRDQVLHFTRYLRSPQALRYPRLQTLILDNTVVTPELVYALPNIRHAVVISQCRDGWNMSLEESLEPVPGAPRPWPYLRSLVLDDTNPMKFRLYYIVAARIDAGIPLSAVKLKWDRQYLPGAEVLYWLQQHVRLEVFHVPRADE